MTDSSDHLVADPPQSERLDDESAAPPVVLLELRDGVPTPLTSAADIDAAVERLARGSGPVAIDAERASGYRYSARAYLIQLRREGFGTVLIDPIGHEQLPSLAEALREPEWILHAASQDLACLIELGLRPSRLFDTELAGRLLGLPRVGLAAMVESLLGRRLEKGHGAADWSTRPLPEPWLRYAALDVEVLIELRDALEQQLRDAGKLDWAHEEFAALAAYAVPPARVEPWRRTSGLHRVRRRRQLAVVREVWETRDRLARDRDSAPGRVLPDAAIVEIALAAPATQTQLAELPGHGRRYLRRRAAMWFEAAQRGLAVADDALPAPAAAQDGPPPVRAWAERDPAAAARLAQARAALSELADQLHLPLENLISPDIVRRLTWSPPVAVTTAEAVAADVSIDGPAHIAPDAVTVAHFLRAAGARDWQAALTADLLARSLRASAERPLAPPRTDGEPQQQPVDTPD